MLFIAHLTHLKEHKQFKYLSEGLTFLKENKGKLSFVLEDVLETVTDSEHNHEVKKSVVTEKLNIAQHGACPGSISRNFTKSESLEAKPQPSQLTNWPIQMHLINPAASYFKNADILLSADCVSYALGDFHSKYLKDKNPLNCLS